VESFCREWAELGREQQVGFRPFVRRLVACLELSGLVCETPGGVMIRAFGPKEKWDVFESRLPANVRPVHVMTWQDKMNAVCETTDVNPHAHCVVSAQGKGGS